MRVRYTEEQKKTAMDTFATGLASGMSRVDAAKKAGVGMITLTKWMKPTPIPGTPDSPTLPKAKRVRRPRLNTNSGTKSQVNLFLQTGDTFKKVFVKNTHELLDLLKSVI